MKQESVIRIVMPLSINFEFYERYQFNIVYDFYLFTQNSLRAPKVGWFNYWLMYVPTYPISGVS